MNIPNPHDLVFKQTQSQIENAIDYIKATFPYALVQHLDLTGLTLEKSSYTTEELKEYFSDLVYQCYYKGKTKITITLLFEHKSFKPHYPHIQLLKYMLTIWETQLREKQSLTPIIPVLFYHGKEKWVIKRFDEYFDGIDKHLKSFIPGYKVIFTNIANFPDEQIMYKLFDRDANKVLFLFSSCDIISLHLNGVKKLFYLYLKNDNSLHRLTPTIRIMLYITLLLKTILQILRQPALILFIDNLLYINSFFCKFFIALFL